MCSDGELAPVNIVIGGLGEGRVLLDENYILII